ncbi:MAG: polyprenol monophosphomannose synthase [Acidimicrobiales bacterium]|jgi:dolichol-phosphate mannosyltransferase
MLPLVVLPTYNESENIESVIRRIREALPEAGVLVVDDGSPDGTSYIAERLGKELRQVEVMRRPAKAGLGSAYRAGFAWGLERGFDAFVEMDSDLSHEPEALPGLVAPLGEGVDLVVGSRYVPGGSIPNWRAHRRLLSQGGNIYASLMLGLHVTDSTSGFRAYSADILRRVDLGSVRAEGYGFQIEMVHRVLEHGGTVTEVPIRFVDRLEGKSKMSGHIVVEALTLVTWWALLRAARGLLGALRPAATPPAVGLRPARRTRAAGRLSPASARRPVERVAHAPSASFAKPYESAPHEPAPQGNSFEQEHEGGPGDG